MDVSVKRGTGHLSREQMEAEMGEGQLIAATPLDDIRVFILFSVCINTAVYFKSIVINNNYA